MNWEDWVESSFNINDEYQIKSNYLYKSNSIVSFNIEDQEYNVKNSDIIVASIEYTIAS